MDKLMNASNASSTDSSFKDGEYVFYVVREADDKNGYVLRFIGDSPKSKHKIHVNLSICENYRKLYDLRDLRDVGMVVKSKYSPERILDDLYECEEPGLCEVRNGILYIRRLYSIKNLVKKRVMMLSTVPEVITEDMKTYRLPEQDFDTGVGTVQWLLNKYADKKSGYNILNAILYNGKLVDLEWVGGIPTRHNLLDRLQYFTQSVGWTPEEIINYLGTGNIRTED